jgi:transketolase
MALENKDTPTGLILSRQNIKDIPAMGSSRYKEALAAEKGGYLVKKADNPDVVLVANGSEVSTLIEAAKLLEERENLKVSIASIISEGLFRLQSKPYQESVIPKNAPLFGLTAGLPVNLEGLVGDKGKVFGLDHFGYSAPANVLDEKFGFTGEKVCQNVIDYLKTV